MKSAALAALGVVHGFPTRAGGVSKGHCDSLNFGYNRGDDENAVAENYNRLKAALSMSEAKLYYNQQVHSGIVRKADIQPSPAPQADGLVTNEKGALLLAFYADCVPVLLYDHEKKVIAAVHSGWKGTAARIAGEAAMQMTRLFGCEQKNIIAAIGPCICKNCYEVGGEVESEFSKAGLSKAFSDNHADLTLANEIILLEAGLQKSNISSSNICTCCDKEFFSHRRMGDTRGVHAAAIALKTEN